jgi:hypothetical protein
MWKSVAPNLAGVLGCGKEKTNVEKAPNSKFQAPEKHQTSSSRLRHIKLGSIEI